MLYFGRCEVRLLRMARPEDAALENRKPDKQDHDRCKIGYLMVGQLLLNGEPSELRLFDLAVLRADGSITEIHEAARAAGNKIV